MFWLLAHFDTVSADRFSSPLLTSLSRVRDRPLMGAGLVEADRMGGCGEDEEDEERMGGDADEVRVGG